MTVTSIRGLYLIESGMNGKAQRSERGPTGQKEILQGDLPVSIIAKAAIGDGIGAPAPLRVVSMALPTAMRISTTGPSVCRFGTCAVKEGTSDPEMGRDEVLRYLYLYDLLYQERNVAKLLIALGDSVHL